MEIPLAEFLRNWLFSILGFPVPVTKTPSLALLVKVLFFIVGLVDSTHTPVPLSLVLMTVTPSIILSLSAKW